MHGFHLPFRHGIYKCMSFAHD
ncbi:unnamed protein product [Victoria cruziana]